MEFSNKKTNISKSMSICLLFVVAAFQSIIVTLFEQQIPQKNTAKTQ